jgi:glycosyltransferase involved in cell wall biosynthesis
MQNTGIGRITTAQFSDSYPPIMDGVAKVVVEYKKHLTDILGPVHIVVPSIPGQDEYNEQDLTHNYPTIPIPKRSPYRFGMPWILPGFSRKIARLPLQLVHVHSPWMAGPLGWQVSVLRQIPIVSTFHTKYLDDISRFFYGMHLPVEIARRIIIDHYNRMDQVWVPNASTELTLREYGFRGPIEIIGHGTDIVKPANPEQSIKQAEEFLGIDAEVPLLVYLGQLKLEKNLLFVLNSLRELKDSGHNFRFAFIGEGYARPELEKAAQDLGLPEVSFPGLVRDRILLTSLLNRSKALVFPSRYDTAGLVIKEAASLEVPSIVLRDSNAAEGIEDEVNGFLSDENPVSFGNKLRYMLDNEDTRRAVGRKAYETLCRSWADVAREVAERYRDLIKVKAHRSA